MKITCTKPTLLIAASISLALATGCSWQVSSNISNDGHVSASDLVFPEIDNAWQKNGQFPNSENLSKIRAGVSKDDLYQLIGRPHFSEAQYAREWDYILKFYRSDDSVQICQYKVIFDKNYKGQEFYWQPAECARYAQPISSNTTVTAPVVIQGVQERISLSADALFAFDKWQPEDIKPDGQQQLDELASKLIGYQQQRHTQVLVTGHTDQLGDAAYNRNLSQLRAQSVRHHLIAQGVDAASIVASGAGASQPITQCNPNQPRADLIDCLQPNRRVEVSVAISTP